MPVFARAESLDLQWPGGTSTGPGSRVQSLLPARWQLYAITLAGALGAAAVAVLTASNPDASPRHIAASGRVALIMILVAAGAYAQVSRLQARMGRLLCGAGLFSCFWLLNGSANRYLFSVGVLASGVAPIVFCGLMLVHPTGRLHSSLERRFLWLVTIGMGGPWTVLWLTSDQPPLRTPLLRCLPHCPQNPFYLGVSTSSVLLVIGVAAWIALAWGTWSLLVRRIRSVPAPLRRAVLPVRWTAFAYAVLLTSFLLLQAVSSPEAASFGTASVIVTLLVPVGIFLGLGLERVFIGTALAEFVNGLSELPGADAQAQMAIVLRDPSLQIVYARPALGTWVDAAGTEVDVSDHGLSRTVTWIERAHQPVAAVIYDGELSDYGRFVQAAGAAALIRLERTQLEADLAASTTDLAASRVRLAVVANSERQRIERDLHDGVQQDLVGLRVKLDMAAEVISTEPERGGRMIASVGQQIDDVLETLRSLASGIYPALLDQHGLGEALKSAARRSPLPTSVDTSGLRRYGEDVEVAVYFCCLEALQNATKHAGRDATAAIRLWHEPQRLCFDVRDTGCGFVVGAAAGHGLVNMRDRIEAVGGTLTISSRPPRGALVRGWVPVP